MEIGVLALQGDFAEHREALERIGVASRLVKHATDLDDLPGLILPGGESTTMLKLMSEEDWLQPLKRFFSRGGAIFGTCAGAILMAERVSSPRQPSLALLDVSIERNAYGRQIASHLSREFCPAVGQEPLEMVFIRAPIIREVGQGVEVLGRHRGDAVFVRQGRAMATTFHPELTLDGRVHRYFLERVIAS